MTNDEAKELEKNIVKIINDVKWILIHLTIIAGVCLFLVIKHCF